MNRKKIVIVSCGLSVAFLLFAIIINCLFKINAKGFFVAEWSSGDVLNYVAAIAGAISTFILGLVAYKQNVKLQQVEEYNYIANNSSMVLIDTFRIEPKAKMPVGYEIHSEQMLEETKNNDDFKTGYDCFITLENMGSAIPSLIFISKATLISFNIKEKTICNHIWAENIREGYTRMHIHGNKKISVSMTLLVSKENQKKLENALTDGNRMIVEFMFIVVTDKYVGTQCRCRASCDCITEGNRTERVSDSPQVFFYGNQILDKNKIVILGDEEDNLFMKYSISK